jgi:hypothetical protein
MENKIKKYMDCSICIHRKGISSSALFECKAQGYNYTHRVYGNEHCKKLFKEIDGKLKKVWGLIK